MAELPDDLISRIFGGASPVRLIREYRKLSQNELASAAGIPPARLRQIEESRKLREGEAERLSGVLQVSKCSFQTVRSRFRGCEEAMDGANEEWKD